MEPIQHLYVHVPFCAAKCHYCAFYSEAGQAGQMADYVTAALNELRSFPGELRPRTVFCGGGTPSLLPGTLWRRFLEGLQQSVALGEVQEWTIECNPATVSSEKARLFREFGVNRISLGVQALDDGLLQTIGRVHSKQAALESYAKLRAAGFDNINLDLMFGLPGQTLAHWEQTLAAAIALAPEHISTYCLILEEDTEFWSLFRQGLLKPNEDLEFAMYERAIEQLTAAGYAQYEVSNFARPGRACRHNIAYWEVRDYLGLGPSACSTVGDRRWQNVPDIARYLAALASGAPARVNEEQLSVATRAAERAAFGMRMTAGVPAEWVGDRWAGPIAELLSAELVQWREGRLQPTRRGILFADQIAAEFV